MRRVIIESPYRGTELNERWRNIGYLRECIADSLRRGEAPFASHKMYPGVLDEDIPSERALGIAAGRAWYQAAEAIIFYVDRGWSPGMKKAFVEAMNAGITIEERGLNANPPNSQS